MTAWQDLKTVPRDGSLIELTCLVNGRPDEGIYRMRWDPNKTNGLFPGQVGFWVSEDDTFTWNDRGDGGPTHWRLLPN